MGKPGLLCRTLYVLEEQLYALGLLPSARLTLPHFLGIGAQKAGTSWLYANLRCHPELYLPDLKEVHYFDLRLYGASLRSYAKRFERGRGKICGEITPAYGVLPRRRIALVHRLMPDLRLLLVLRDPVERAWSHALMELVTQPQRRYEDVREEEFLAHFRSMPSIRRSDYCSIHDNWLSRFRPDQFYVGFFDDITEQPCQMLADIFDHLGVSRDVDWAMFPVAEVVFSGPGIPLPDSFRGFLLELYHDNLVRIAERFGPRAARWHGVRPKETPLPGSTSTAAARPPKPQRS